MKEVIFELRCRRGNFDPPRSGNDVAMVGALDALDIVAIKFLPHRQLFRIARQRPGFRRFQRPVAAAAPRSSAGIAGRPKLMAGAAAPRCDVVRGEQSVDENLSLAFLQAETSRIAECLFTVARWGTGPFHPRHVDAMHCLLYTS